MTVGVVRYALMGVVILGFAEARAQEQEPVMAATPNAELQRKVTLLSDARATRMQKLEALDALAAAGRDAMPLLVARLAVAEDPIFLDDTPVPTGPMNPGPPLNLKVTVHFACQMTLYRILTPTPAKPSAAAFLPPDTRPPVQWVKDWQAFWKAHSKESLEQMRTWSAAEIDRIWHDAATKGPARKAR